MNPFLNPIFLSKVLRSYLVEPQRLRRMNNEEIKRFQGKSLRRMVRYAYETPLYRQKYKTFGIHPQDIRDIDDIKKLPCITKEDLRRNFPLAITPPSFNQSKGILASTSATTGEPLSLYFDLFTALQSMLGFIRILQEHEINWRKKKIALLLDLLPHSFENGYFLNSVFPAIKPLTPLHNIQVFDICSSPVELIQKLNTFQPEVIIGYPFVLISLANLKERDCGKNVNPSMIVTSGAYFDRHSRKRVEEAFHATTFDIYAATESGPIAFECRKKRYHVLSDLINLEVAKNHTEETSNKPGTVIITKLYGNGTPIIRYTGINDVVTPTTHTCSCGLAGGLIDGIHGRKSDALLLPGNTIACISFFDSVIGETLSQMKSVQVKRIQLVQKILEKIEIKIALEDTGKTKEQTIKELFCRIRTNLLKQLRCDIEVVITQVDRFDERAPYVISKMEKKNIGAITYLV